MYYVTGEFCARPRSSWCCRVHLRFTVGPHQLPISLQDLQLHSARAGRLSWAPPPYLSSGIALVRPRDVRSADGENADQATLYRNERLFDAGSINNCLHFRLGGGRPLAIPAAHAVGIRLGACFQQAARANFRVSGGRQPSEASLDPRQFLLAGFHDPPAEIAQDRPTWPYPGTEPGTTDSRERSRS